MTKSSPNTVMAEVKLKIMPISTELKPNSSVPYRGIIVPRMLENKKNMRKHEALRVRIRRSVTMSRKPRLL